MKISASLPDEDLEFLDAYAKSRRLPSRSAAVSKAVRTLRTAELAEQYEDAWRGWLEDSEEEWSSTTSDGLA
ncbi:MAG: ribbon-helix-helix domain-containing protein [Actinomycetota bacterium]|nr:ribbon-helix-helix domain-containing protein [Actinomycetota bacterium]